MLVVAHLFGVRLDLTPYVEFCRKHNILLFEDLAQAVSWLRAAPSRAIVGCDAPPTQFDGFDHPSHPGADIAGFSFGTIKTCSALGGAVIVFRSRELCERVRARQVRERRRSPVVLVLKSSSSFVVIVCRLQQSALPVRSVETFRSKIKTGLGSIWLIRPWIYYVAFKLFMLTNDQPCVVAPRSFRSVARSIDRFSRALVGCRRLTITLRRECAVSDLRRPNPSSLSPATPLVALTTSVRCDARQQRFRATTFSNRSACRPMRVSVIVDIDRYRLSLFD